MSRFSFPSRALIVGLSILGLERFAELVGQEPVAANAYTISLPADPPYYRVRYEASSKPGELAYPVSFSLWLPPDVRTLRGIVVHQHGCGEGSCKSGQTGAHDLHWQALARKHDCALLSPSYEQPDKADCQLWCDPRNGSDQAFQKSLADLAVLTGHPELATVPWALWGHSGGGHWAGGMTFLHPDRVAAAWLRSGVPPLKVGENKPNPWTIPGAACQVPILCNLGTKEGVTIRDGRFAKVWEGVESFVHAMRSKDALIGIAVDPYSSHDCGNQRYLAIPWLDTCLTARLPTSLGSPLKPMSIHDGWLGGLDPASFAPLEPKPAIEWQGTKESALWFPNETIAKAWKQYSVDAAVSDTTPPPAPSHIRVVGKEITWEASADLESGLAKFIIERDGVEIAAIEGKNAFGRAIFQNNSYSDTPTQPLVPMKYIDEKARDGETYQYRVFAVNTVGLKSK